MAGNREPQLRDDPRVLLRVRNLAVEYPAAGGERVHAVSGVSFDVIEGETLALVGESGCGKSSTGLAIMRLQRLESGSIELEGTDLAQIDGRNLRRLRSRFQMVFQDPISSLNPRRRVGDIIAEPLRIWSHDRGGHDREATDQEARVREMLDAVGLDPDQTATRRPHAFSGGQLQRICIARALILRPRLVVCDEPVSSLDVSIQAQILNLLKALKDRYGLTLVFIAHDLAVVKNVSDRVAVMYLGKLCEIGDADAIYERPAHPYTRLLLDSVPRLNETRDPPNLNGEVPSPTHPPSGCRFRTRCPRATSQCAEQEPEMRPAGPDHYAACWHPLGAADQDQSRPHG